MKRSLFEAYKPQIQFDELQERSSKPKKRTYLHPALAKSSEQEKTEYEGQRSYRKQMKQNLIKHVVDGEDEFQEDDDGHLNCNLHDIINGYSIVSYLGKGGFGRVNKVCRKKTGEMFALKILKNTDECKDAGRLEVQTLHFLKDKDPEGIYLWVQMFDAFEFRGHVCIAYEILGPSLHDFMRENKFQPYPMEDIRIIAHQICFSIKALHDLDVVHTDLKPENICFANPEYSYGMYKTRRTSFRFMDNTNIRIIDFGGAEHQDENRNYVIQTTNYRAPEVVFGLNWSKPIDCWSIGCIIFELYHGSVLFPIGTDKEHACWMSDILGPMPIMFTSTELGKQLEIDQTLRPKKDKEKSLRKNMRTSKKETKELFDLLEKLLMYNPIERLTLKDALNHPFFGEKV